MNSSQFSCGLALIIISYFDLSWHSILLITCFPYENREISEIIPEISNSIHLLYFCPTLQLRECGGIVVEPRTLEQEVGG